PYQYFSEGTLRLLAYAVLFSSPELPEAVVIDDIETALDDGHIAALMQIVQETGKRTNIIDHPFSEGCRVRRGCTPGDIIYLT
ncbi:MAG: hypothetical protein MJ014_04890, partial [Methanocorpusculum sp.]|nr:hypothetical protein [Methanocorpusculum sp.]